MSEAQRGPPRMLMGIVVQFLLELEERLCKEHPTACVAIEHLLGSLVKSMLNEIVEGCFKRKYLL